MSRQHFKIGKGVSLTPVTARPSDPENGDIIYNNANTQFERYENGAWGAFGSGSSSSGVTNLVTNGNADSASASIFVPYADAAGTRPVDGTGGSPNVTTTLETTSPLNGLKSFNLIKPASNVQGQGWSIPITVDTAFKAKSLKISVDYIIASGTFVPGNNGSSPTDGDVIWYIYDVTNSQLIEPSNIKMFSNGTTLSDKFEATFQTSATGSSYRLIAHVASTSALAYTLIVDNVTVSPQVYVYGSPETDFQSYTPTFTGFGTVTGSEFQWRRVGDSVEVFGSFTTGTTSGVEARVSLPNSLSASAAKIASLKVVGSLFSAGNFAGSWSVLAENSAAYFTFGIQGTSSAGYSKTNGNVGFAGATSYSFYAKVPVNGASSSVQMSDAADTRVEYASLTMTTNQTTASGTTPKVQFNSILEASHGNFSTSNNRYTVLSSGKFSLSGTVAFAASATGSRAVTYRINGGSDVYLAQIFNAGATDIAIIPFSGDTPYLKAGDYVEIFASQNSGGTLNIASAFTNLFISKVNGPQAIAASEKVSFSYGVAAGQSFSASTAFVFRPDTKSFDTHNIFNTATGIWKMPRAGRATIRARALTQNIAAGTTSYYGQLIVKKNGTIYKVISGRYNPGAGTTTYAIGEGSCVIEGLSSDSWTIEGSYGVASTVFNDVTESYIDFMME